MRVRTVYFKVDRMAEAVAWWREFLEAPPAKEFDAWTEFRIGDVNLGFLPLGDGPASQAACVPVLECNDEAADQQIAKAKRLGARAILEGEKHPDYPHVAAVLVDPFGNEFEITDYHG